MSPASPLVQGRRLTPHRVSLWLMVFEHHLKFLLLLFWADACLDLTELSLDGSKADCTDWGLVLGETVTQWGSLAPLSPSSVIVSLSMLKWPFMMYKYTHLSLHIIKALQSFVITIMLLTCFTFMFRPTIWKQDALDTHCMQLFHSYWMAEDILAIVVYSFYLYVDICPS